MFMYKGKLVYTLKDITELFKEDKTVRNYIYRKMKKKYKKGIRENICIVVD